VERIRFIARWRSAPTAAGNCRT